MAELVSPPNSGQMTQKQSQMTKLTMFDQFNGTQDHRERKKQNNLSWKDIKDRTSFMWGLFICLYYRAAYVSLCENCRERRQFHQKKYSEFSVIICN